jgi:hypothetical protein
MVKNTQDLIGQLKKLRLFVGLDAAQLEQVAQAIVVVELTEGQPLSLPADRDYPFFLVVDGSLRQQHKPKNGNVETLLLKKEDFFGAEVLLLGGRHNYQINALEPATLYQIEPRSLSKLLRSIPALRKNVREQLRIYRNLHRKIFNWVSEFESVHMIVRQHPAHLIVSLMWALFLAWLALLAFIVSSVVESSTLQTVLEWTALGMFGVAFFWGLWKILDYLNDYYVVTDQRVVWLERVIFLYESRVEAPLSAVKSEEVTTSWLGRLLGYGDVTTYAFLGQVVFSGIASPNEVRKKIEDLRKLSAQGLAEADQETRTDILRNKLYPPPVPEAPAEPAPAQAEAKKPAPPRQTLSFGTRFRRFFQSYVEEGGVITYRKHIFILFKKVFFPSLILLFFLGFAVYMNTDPTISAETAQTVVIIMLILIIPVSLWWLYQYVDWRNDIYQIREDRVIDAERKPLGTESIKSAPLENILSLDYERIGLLGVLLNMGNVIINTGTDKLTWMTITNPARAQREIFNRMIELRRRKEQADTQKKWDQEADWLVTYDRIKAEKRRSEEIPPQS